MANIGFHQRGAYLIIVLGILLNAMMSILPHYNLSHRLVLDIFILGILPYVLYSLFTVSHLQLSLFVTGLVILSVDLFIRIPAWWGIQAREIPERLYYTPIISSVTIIPAIFLLFWIMRRNKR